MNLLLRGLLLIGGVIAADTAIAIAWGAVPLRFHTDFMHGGIVQVGLPLAVGVLLGAVTGAWSPSTSWIAKIVFGVLCIALAAVSPVVLFVLFDLTACWMQGSCI